MKNRLLNLAGALALVAVLSKFYAVPAIAQVRAAVIKSVDEKGRSPYVYSFGLLTASTGGSTTMSGSPVPAGKRLVIEHVNANATYTSGMPRLSLDSAGTQQYLPLQGQSTDFGVINEHLLIYYEAGSAPTLRLEVVESGSARVISTTISGYLVDLTQ